MQTPMVRTEDAEPHSTYERDFYILPLGTVLMIKLERG